MDRLRFATFYALRHGLLSFAIAGISASFVFGLLYPPPYQTILNVGSIFWLLLVTDVVCGPLLTLLLASPKKSKRERWVDFFLVGAIQLTALLYGMHSVWVARPVVLAFEVNRLVVVTANEVQTHALNQAPAGLQNLPWWGTLQVSTRPPQGSDEALESIDLSINGISPAMRPNWWLPWGQANEGMRQHSQPIANLLQFRPQDEATLHAAIIATGLPQAQLRYVPLISSKSTAWIALLDKNLNVVGYAPVDGF